MLVVALPLRPTLLRAQLDDTTTAIGRAAHEVRVAMGAYVYWPDARDGESAVRDCQARFITVCAADHFVSRLADPSLALPRSELDLDQLAFTLGNAMEAFPEEGWFVGQYVYLLLARRADDQAVAAAWACGADWWCSALRGLALHETGRYVEAGAAFDQALAGMPDERRCRWRDVTPLLEESARNVYRRTDCADRVVFEQRLWWLSDPLMVLQGNDRRTEHFARQVRDSILSGSQAPLFRGWDAGLSELQLRYGLPHHWISRPAWAHYHFPNYHFVPAARGLSSDDTLGPDAWALHAPLAETRERYQPAYGFMAELRHHQLALFKRGDSMLVAGALAPAEEPIGQFAPFAVGLAIAQTPESATAIQLVGNRRGRTSLTLMAPRTRVLLGLEALSQEYEVAGRVRLRLDPPAWGPGPAVSDLILYAPDSLLPQTVEQAASAMLGTQQLLRSEPVGVFWEMYDFARGTEARITVTAIPLKARVGVLRRLGRIVGLSRTPSRVVVSLDQQLFGGAVESRALVLDLGSLVEGPYRLEVSVHEGLQRWGAAREIEVVSRRPAEPSLAEAIAPSWPFAPEFMAAMVRQRPTPMRVLR